MAGLEELRLSSETIRDRSPHIPGIGWYNHKTIHGLKGRIVNVLIYGKPIVIYRRKFNFHVSLNQIVRESSKIIFPKNNSLENKIGYMTGEPTDRKIEGYLRNVELLPLAFYGIFKKWRIEEHHRIVRDEKSHSITLRDLLIVEQLESPQLLFCGAGEDHTLEEKKEGIIVKYAKNNRPFSPKWKTDAIFGEPIRIQLKKSLPQYVLAYIIYAYRV